MSSQVRFVLGYHHHMALSRVDDSGTTRALVGLASRVGLNKRDYFYAKSAHTTTTAVITVAPTTITMSASPRRWGRKGLKPMVQC
jgi:hypothetical protein